MVLKGYKCFNANLTNRYGCQYEVGKEYHKDSIKFGNGGHGFHICKRLVDTFRYFDTTNFALGEVTCWGDFEEYNDEYNGYYDMYAFEYMRIDRIIPREEIIDEMLNADVETIKRFLQTFTLRPEEIELFFEKFSDNLLILKYLSYFQIGYEKAFELYNDKKEIKEVYSAWTKSLSKGPEKTT